MPKHFDLPEYILEELVPEDAVNLRKIIRRAHELMPGAAIVLDVAGRPGEGHYVRILMCMPDWDNATEDEQGDWQDVVEWWYNAPYDHRLFSVEARHLVL